MPKGLTVILRGRRNCTVTANSVTGIAVPQTKAQNTRPSSDAGAFFMPATVGACARQFMAGGTGEPQGSPALGPVLQSRVARHPLRNAEVAVIQHTETAP